MTSVRCKEAQERVDLGQESYMPELAALMEISAEIQRRRYGEDHDKTLKIQLFEDGDGI